MRLPLARGLFLAIALAASTSFASRMKSFEDSAPTLTSEELAEQRAAARGEIDRYGSDVPQQTKPFPWLAAGLALLSVLACAPFALGMYHRMSQEISGAQAFGYNKGGKE